MYIVLKNSQKCGYINRKVKPENYKNYFEYAYRTNNKTEYARKPST